MNLTEAFRALNALNEDTFSVSDDGINKLSEFEQNDDLVDEVPVIDTEAETEDDLEGSYVGKVILDCGVCHSKIYKDKSEVELNEDQTLANVGEECPYCYTSDGFKVIGEVAEFGGEDEEEETEVEDTEDAEGDSEDVVEESLNEGIFDKKYNYKGFTIVRKKADKYSSVKYVYVVKKIPSDATPVDKYEAQNLQTSNFHSLENAQKSIDLAYFGDSDAYQANRARIKQEIEDDNKKRAQRNAVDDERFFTSRGAARLDNERKEQARKDKAHAAAARSSRGNDEDDDTWTSMTGKKLKYNPHKDTYESLEESVNAVNVETDDETISFSTDENGNVTMSTSPVGVEDGDEMIAPVSDETQAEIEGNGEEEMLADGEEMPAEGEGEEVAMDDFDEESFDELGESYLRGIYENVSSYKTTQVRSRGNKLTVEGVIKFNSGNSKKTSFIFEAKDITKSGKVRFIGENVNITKGKKAFSVRGRVDGKKFISESLNYNYRQKDESGKSTRVYGTVRTQKRG